MITTPLQGGITGAASWVGSRFSSIFRSDRLRQEMEELMIKNSLLEIENERLLQAEEENALLTALLDMASIYEELPTVGARVIAKDPNNWHDRYIIDKGENDGIRPNMAVIGIGGLLGVVRDVYPTSSTVVTIIDNGCAVAVVNKRTEDIGVVRGDLGLMPQGRSRMEYIEAEGQIMPGDELYTSSHSSIFPESILVGVVESVASDDNGLTRYAIVRPEVELNNVGAVLVVFQVYEDYDGVGD